MMEDGYSFEKLFKIVFYVNEVKLSEKRPNVPVFIYFQESLPYT